jgi:hypothetical protein
MKYAGHRPVLAGSALLMLLTACGEQNRFVAPPPPKVSVALPVQQTGHAVS